MQWCTSVKVSVADATCLHREISLNVIFIIIIFLNEDQQTWCNRQKLQL